MEVLLFCLVAMNTCMLYNTFVLFTRLLVVEYSCLGDWFVGKNHFFAVANTKESRKDEKYRCFLKNREDDYFLGVSITPECNVLKTVEKASAVVQSGREVLLHLQLVLLDDTFTTNVQH